MFAIEERPLGREFCCTPSRLDTPAGRATAPPKSPNRATVAPCCSRTGRATEDHSQRVRRDDSLLEMIIVDWQKKTPRPMARGAAVACEDDRCANNSAPASNQNWWGRQACSCHGAGRCLCCRRFDRAIRAHQARVAAAGAC